MEIVVLIGQILIGLVLLTFLVVIHELGHAITARRNGVVVEEFGIGFPPRAWAKKLKNKVLLSINWLPLGGFVKLQGENDAANKKGDYGRASLWVKTKILLAGVTINWLFAALGFSILALIGLPQVIPNQFTVASDTKVTTESLRVTYVEKGSPADTVGIKQGDRIKSIGGQAINTPEELQKSTKNNRGKTVQISYLRQNEQKSVQTKLRANPGKKQGALGIGTFAQTTNRSNWSAPIVGIGVTAQLSIATIQGIGDLLVNLGQGLVSQLSFEKNVRDSGGKELSEAGASVAGPIAILGVIFPAAQQSGPEMVLFLMAYLSMALAVMNVLPIPALDGGRLFLTLLFKALKKPLTKELEEKIVGISFMCLLALVVLVTFSDVSKFF